MPHILVIEDDDRIRGALTRTLGERGHSVTDSATALAGLQRALDDRPDLVLLDLGLPDLDGLELLRMLRAVSTVPVIVATARDDNADVVAALNAGADDYVIKPFNTEQLAARIAAVLRRSAEPATGPEPLTVGGLAVDVRSRRVVLDSTPIELIPRNSISSPISPHGSARWCPNVSCWPRSGACRTPARTRRSTFTCPGCAESSVNRHSNRDTCKRSGVSASDSPSRRKTRCVGG